MTASRADVERAEHYFAVVNFRISEETEGAATG